jgi:hypothetical protein
MSTISAGTTSTTTLIASGDTTGTLVLKSNDTGSGGTTAVTIDTSQNATFAGKVASAGSLVLASNGTTTAVTIDTAQSLNLSGAYTEAVVAIGNSGTTKTLSLATGTFQTVTMTGNCTFTMPTAVAGKSFILLISTGAGGFTGTFTSVKWPNNTAPTLTTTATRWDAITFFSDGTNWYGAFQQAYQ